MSSTRHAAEDSPLRQERWASSPAFAGGLKANLVAKKCSLIESAADRQLIWFLQKLSHTPGMAGVARELLERFSKNIGTASMRGITGACNAKQVAAIRAEIPNTPDKFLLHGEMSEMEKRTCECYGCDENRGEPSERYAKDIHTRAAQRPKQIAITEFKEFCRDAAADDLDSFLIRLCLDPETTLESPPWYFAELVDCLRELQIQWTAEQRKGFIQTEVAEAVHTAIDYATQTREMILATGALGSGVTSAAKNFCNQNPGYARYVLVPAGNDRKGFFMAIAEALGVPDGLRSKARELQERCEQALELGDITLVFDNANDLLPCSNLRESMPDRLQWILSALISRNVSVVLLGLPNFLEKLQLFHGKGGWLTEEFTFNCDCRELPELRIPDLGKIAKLIFPAISLDELKDLCAYAFKSEKRLAAIRAVKASAAYDAHKQNRETTSEDVAKALILRVVPSDQILHKDRSKGRKRAALTPVDREAIAPASREITLEASAPTRDCGELLLQSGLYK